ncbi:MAG TPA: ACT domain-containing protein [Clostridiales bacterium]|nr:ACT domain-containing protein [Clostridiales bacterium]
MFIKQLSVFVENIPGRLERVSETLMDNNINIESFSLADSSEFGVFRMIVSNPDLGLKVLKKEGFSAMLTDVLAIKISQKPGTLHKVLKRLYDEKISVEYMYTLSTSGDNTSIIMKLSDLEKGLKLLINNDNIIK